MTDLAEALRRVIRDLWDHQPLVDLLESQDAIDEGWPADSQEFPVVVRVQPATEVSTWRGGGLTERTHRFQISVVAKQEWREGKARPTYEMARIMSEIAERLDVASGIPKAQPGGVASGSTQEVAGSRVALIQDWRIVVRPTRESDT